MNILVYPHHWFPKAAGGEWYMLHLLRGLRELGHEIKIVPYCQEQYAHDGFDCYPAGPHETIYTLNNDLIEWCDVIFYQLIGTAHGFNKAKQFNKPSVFFAHNTSKHYWVENAKVVYNSNHLANMGLFPNPYTILQPLIPFAPQCSGTKIALINCNYNKGGHLFVELAKMLPQYDFIAYKGSYGEQYTGDPVTYYENGEINWPEIAVLLVLSEFESWSQVATEAIMRGIPVICNDIPPLRENLSYAGIYIPIKDLSLYAKTIEYLMWDSSKQVELCLKRAKELDPEPRLLKFNEWLIENV